MSDRLKASPFILLLLFALSQSTESAFSTGLPQLSEDFDIPNNYAQTASSIYFYGFATGIFFLGRLSDQIGRRPVILLGLALFFITCILCFFARTIEELIVIRFFQAFGASVGSVVAQAVARDGYYGMELSKLFSTLGAAISTMPSVSSFIGSNVTQYYGWRYIFIYLCVLSGVTLLACFFKLQETNQFKGAINKYSFSEVFNVIAFDKKVVSFGIIIGSFNGILYSFFIEIPFAFIEKIGIDNAQYSYIALIMGLAAAFGGFVCRFIQGKVDGKDIILYGIYLCMSATFLLVSVSLIWYNNLISDSIALLAIIIPACMFCFSFGLSMPISIRYALEDYKRVNGTAGAIFGTFYYFIIASCSFITTRLHNEDHIVYSSTFFMILSIVSYILYLNSRDYEHYEKPFDL